jgi:hypothetical protein
MGPLTKCARCGHNDDTLIAHDCIAAERDGLSCVWRGRSD